MHAPRIEAHISTRKLVRPFSISTGSRTHQPVLSVRIRDGDFIGRGEATGVSYRAENAETMLPQIKAIPEGAALTRQTLSDHLPPGGAMSALDAALWEIEAVREKTGVASLLNIKPKSVASAFTIVLDSPEAMSRQTRDEAWRPLLKVKLGGSPDQEADRIKAVRAAAPDARLVIDANAGWTHEQLRVLVPIAQDQGYELIEQPLHMRAEEDPAIRDALTAAGEILPLCADESFQTMDDLERCARAYKFINIKLDKCGGLTPALTILEAARARGLGIFVGCMVAPTIAIAPAHLLAQMADYADLDGPFWFPDEPVRLTRQGHFASISSEIWGEGINASN